MPTPPSTEDTGCASVAWSSWGWLKFWRKPKSIPLPAVVEFTVSDDPEADLYFLWGSEGLAINQEKIESDERLHQARLDRVAASYVPGEKNLPGREPSVYTFEDRTGPMRPRSALYVPRPLNSIEASAVALAEVLEGVKPKGPLKKKVADLKKGQRRVIVQPDGKLVDVK